MSVLDHFPIIEVICKHLDLKTLRSMIFVSKKCARFFRESDWMQRNLSRLIWLHMNSRLLDLAKKIRIDISLLK